MPVFYKTYFAITNNGNLDLRLNLVCGKGKRSFSRVHNATDNQNSRADRDNHVTIGNNNDNIEVLLPQIRQKFVRVP